MVVMKVARISRPVAAGIVLAGLAAASSQVAFSKTTLTIAMWRNDPPTAKYTQALLNEYAKKNNINVKLVYAPWQAFLDKLLTMAAAGQIPDVIVVERRWLPRFADNKLIRPLDDVVAAEKFDPKKRLSETKSGYYNRKFYGFPIWGGPALQYYNPAMFTAAGVPDPSQLIASGKWTWQDYLEVGRKITKDTNGDGKPDIYGLDGVSTWSPDWVAKIRQNGGDIFDETYKKVLVNQPAAVEGLQFWVDLANRYNIAPRAGAGAGFDSRKSALAGGWLSEAVTRKEAIKKKGIDMQLTLYPAGKAGYVHVAGGCPVSVSASTRNFKEAYKLAKWFAMDSDEWKNTGAPASRATYEGAYQDFLDKNFTNAGPVVRKAMENTDPEPCIHPRHQLIEEAQLAALTPALQGKISAAQAAQRMADDLTRIIGRK